MTRWSRTLTRKPCKYTTTSIMPLMSANLNKAVAPYPELAAKSVAQLLHDLDNPLTSAPPCATTAADT